RQRRFLPDVASDTAGDSTPAWPPHISYERSTPTRLAACVQAPHRRARTIHLARPAGLHPQAHNRPIGRECARVRNPGPITVRETRFADLRIPIDPARSFAPRCLVDAERELAIRPALRGHLRRRGIAITIPEPAGQKAHHARCESRGVYENDGLD